ncbi:JHBP domain containing protein [Asbolus verrucosus]|uniref:JHBP domain containing protein n=1 Tax=Asbolus verrucosus TaxID=1661398 RepID=A0A482W974_ASBVE|nr:JHBP domain containing protein [Asbolus verrucosus]
MANKSIISILIFLFYSGSCNQLRKLLLLLLLLLSNGKKSASSFKKCDQKQADFNQCLAAAVQDAITQLKEPIPELGLPGLEPLEIPNLNLPAGSGAVLFSQNYKNFKIFGLTKVNVSKFEFENNTINMECIFPELRFEFDYNFVGKLLLVPIRGAGPGNASLADTKFIITFHMEEYEKDGKKFLKVVESEVKKLPRLMTVHLGNLTGENDVLRFGLGNIIDINKLINDNWAQLFDEVKNAYQEFYARTFSVIFNNLLEKVPISELFGEK